MDINITFPVLFNIDCASSSCSEILSCTANVAMAITAVVALVVSCKEYCNHKRRERANVLSRYNERYSESESIKRVIKHINAIAYRDCDSLESNDDPGTFDKEMFMRFFEELEYSIQADNINKKEVRDMFGFYPLLATERKGYLYNDDEKENWRMFCKFVKRMKGIKPLSPKDKGEFPAN